MPRIPSYEFDTSISRKDFLFGSDGDSGLTKPTKNFSVAKFIEFLEQELDVINKGEPGEGVPVGGTAGQVLQKVDETDYNTQWTDPVADWSDLTNRPEYVESSSNSVLIFSDVEVGYRVGTPDVPVSTDTFTLSTLNETPGVSNLIYFNGPAFPSFVLPVGRTATIYNQNIFEPFEDCRIEVLLEPDGNYTIDVEAPITLPDTTGLATKATPVIEVGGTTYTLTADNFGAYTRFTSDIPVTVTVPADLVLDYNVASFQQVGAGEVTFTPAVGVTLSPVALVMSRPNSVLQLIQTANNTYDGIAPAVLDADDIDDSATTNKFVTSADITKLSNTSGTNTGDQDLSGLATKSTSVITVAGTTYTLTEANFGAYTRFTSADPVTVTIPAGLSLTYNVASFKQVGAGLVTFSPAAGVTVNTNLVMDGQGSALQLIEVAADEYDEIGGVI